MRCPFRVRTSIITVVCVLNLHPSQIIYSAQDKQVESIVLTEGTPLDVITVEGISSKTAGLGDVIAFKVDQDVIVNGHVVISRGTSAKGRVINAEPSGHLGRSGKLGVVVESTTTVDGQPLKLRAAKGNEGRDRTMSTAILATTVSWLFLLKRGTNAEIPAGTRITVSVAEEKRFHVTGGTLVADNLPAVPDTPKADALGASSASPAQSVTVFIYRPEKFVGYGKEPSVFCDGVKLAQMDNGRYFALRLRPGKHIVHLTNKKKGFAIEMGAGEIFYFRLSIEMGVWDNRGKLTLEDPERALPEIKKLKYIGKGYIAEHTMVLESDPTRQSP